MKKTFAVLAVVVALISFLMLYSYIILNKKVDIKQQITIEIPRASSIANVVSIFNKYNMLSPDFIFTNYIKIISKLEHKHILAGNYTIEPGNTNGDILKKIFSGGVIPSVTLTFPEGITMEDFASIAQKAGIDSTEFIDLCHNDSLLAARGIDAGNVEGFLMPDTYNFFKKSSARQIIDKLLNRHFNIWDKYFITAAAKAGISHSDAIILASIIELETPIDDEKAIISGVYINRIRAGMPLQADPTVQYAVGKKERITYSDLQYDSPYNTYLYPGLPPGPICSPGQKAIEAAVFPEKHSYYYFVAIGDGSGKHNFTRDYSQHQRNTANYRKNRRNSR